MMIIPTFNLLAISALLLPSTLAQSSSSVSSVVSSSHASAASSSTPSTTTSAVQSAFTIVPGDGDYTYAGCWNETTGIPGANNVRALSGGIMRSETDMTPQVCIALCASNGTTPYNYAGLEYGRECWCATYLSSLSTKLPDSACNINCAAQPDSVCGGSLTITLYNRTGPTKKNGGATATGSQWWSLLGATVGVVAMLGWQ